jgi:hypothetical protein
MEMVRNKRGLKMDFIRNKLNSNIANNRFRSPISQRDKIVNLKQKINKEKLLFSNKKVTKMQMLSPNPKQSPRGKTPAKTSSLNARRSKFSKVSPIKILDIKRDEKRQRSTVVSPQPSYGFKMRMMKNCFDMGKRKQSKVTNKFSRNASPVINYYTNHTVVNLITNINIKKPKLLDPIVKEEKHISHSKSRSRYTIKHSSTKL